MVKTIIRYWKFNDRKEHGFSNQLVNVKLLKHAKELEEVEYLKDIWKRNLVCLIV
jgi:hypothetical protein